MRLLISNKDNEIIENYDFNINNKNIINEKIYESKIKKEKNINYKLLIIKMM